MQFTIEPEPARGLAFEWPRLHAPADRRGRLPWIARAGGLPGLDLPGEPEFAERGVGREHRESDSDRVALDAAERCRAHQLRIVGALEGATQVCFELVRVE